MFRKLLDQGEAGDNVGVLLRGTKREEVERGQVLCKQVLLPPIQSLNVRPTFWRRMKVVVIHHSSQTIVQFYFRTTDVTGSVVLPEGTEIWPHCWCRCRRLGHPSKGGDKRALVRQWSLSPTYRSVAQLVEHRSPKPGAGGSSPSTHHLIDDPRPSWRGFCLNTALS